MGTNLLWLPDHQCFERRHSLKASKQHDAIVRSKLRHTLPLSLLLLGKCTRGFLSRATCSTNGRSVRELDYSLEWLLC